EYGVLCRPAFGHALVYAARRASPAGNFGPFLGEEKYRNARRFYEAPSEDEAVALADALRVRFVMTTERAAPTLRNFVARLHAGDGSALPRRPHSGHFRLVVEAAEGGAPFRFEMEGPRPRTAIPYKLFERVEGARLQVEAPPGAAVRAHAGIRTRAGRRFSFEAVGTASAAGVAELRVPYATESAGAPAFAEGPFEIEAGTSSGSAAIAEADVVEGREVRVPLTR